MYKVRKYYKDRVMSLTHDDGKQAFSVGIIAPGTYEFGAISDERYRVTSGEIYCWEEDSDEWKKYSTDQVFTVQSHKNFIIKTKEVSSYICFY